jgi:hypothetical protein
MVHGSMEFTDATLELPRHVWSMVRSETWGGQRGGQRRLLHAGRFWVMNVEALVHVLHSSHQ